MKTPFDNKFEQWYKQHLNRSMNGAFVIGVGGGFCLGVLVTLIFWFCRVS
jgi:hypothetical protein